GDGSSAVFSAAQTRSRLSRTAPAASPTTTYRGRPGTTWVSISTGMASIPRVVALQTRIIGGVSWPGFYYRHLAPPKRNSSREDYEITSSFRISTASRSNSTGPLKRLFVGPFSRRRTPRGQTVAHIPQPTQEA